MGYKVVKTEGGKTNWNYLQSILYVGLIVWAIGVRWWSVNPFDDFLALRFDLGTLMDILVLWALWLVVWFFIKRLRAEVRIG